MSRPDVVAIVGGGHAAAIAATELRRLGFNGQITVVSTETVPPYDRTTLSKSSLLSGEDPPRLWPELDKGIPEIDLRLGTTVTSFDPAARSLTLSNGEQIGYDRLLLALGAEPRRLSLPGADADGVLYLRNFQDARVLRSRLERDVRVAIIGGGLIGLEVAACASSLGHHVNVIEAGNRVLGRSVSESVASTLVDLHREHGVVFHCATAPTAIATTPEGLVRGVELADGSLIDADVVVVGIGIVPRDQLAAEAGLSVADGIIVNAQCRTSDEHIYAAGDVIRFPTNDVGETIRLEAWQPACRQAGVAAAAMLGYSVSYHDCPWGWSDQYDAFVQTVGVHPPDAEVIDYGDPRTPRGLLSLSLVDGNLVAAAGVSIGSGIAKSIRLVQMALDAGRRPVRGELQARRGDLASLGQYLQRSLRAG